MCEVAVVALDYLRGLKLHQPPLIAAMLLVLQEHEITLCPIISVWPARCGICGTAHLPWKARLRRQLVAKLLLFDHVRSWAVARAAALEKRMACMSIGEGSICGAEVSPEWHEALSQATGQNNR